MTDNMNIDSAREAVVLRLYQELNQIDVLNPDFQTTLEKIQSLEKAKDYSVLELEKLKLQTQIKREEQEAAKLESEAFKIQTDAWATQQESEKEEKKESFFARHGDAIITAAAGTLGVVLVVSAESIGNKILNSKAMKMPTMKF